MIFDACIVRKGGFKSNGVLPSDELRGCWRTWKGIIIYIGGFLNLQVYREDKSIIYSNHMEIIKTIKKKFTIN